MRISSFRLFILVLFLVNTSFGQDLSNLQIFNNLADSVSEKIIRGLPNSNSNLEITSTNDRDLNILYEFIKIKLIRSGIKLGSESEYDEKISLSFSEAKVEYNNLFKDHLFGNYYMSREINLSGNFVLERKNQVFDFSFSYSDTVAFDNYTKLESKIYPITEGIPPKEPFFSNLIEPVIAIAATATAVILFFTIRSK
jgi:hypothetical protein